MTPHPPHRHAAAAVRAGMFCYIGSSLLAVADGPAVAARVRVQKQSVSACGPPPPVPGQPAWCVLRPQCRSIRLFRVF